MQHWFCSLDSGQLLPSPAPSAPHQQPPAIRTWPLCDRDDSRHDLILVVLDCNRRAGLHALKKSFLAEASCRSGCNRIHRAGKNRVDFYFGARCCFLESLKENHLDQRLYCCCYSSPISLVGRLCRDQTHGLFFALSVMDEGTGRGSSKRKGLLVPSAVVKSLQISMWWERASGGVERPHPGDFKTQGLNKTRRPVSSRGSQRAPGCAAGCRGCPQSSEHPLATATASARDRVALEREVRGRRLPKRLAAR